MCVCVCVRACVRACVCVFKIIMVGRGGVGGRKRGREMTVIYESITSCKVVGPASN